MLLPRVFLWLFSIAVMMLGAGVLSGQDYPNKAIRIVTTPPGGSADVVARVIAQGVSAPLGQQVVVENRPSGIIPGEIVSKAPPDGYTVLVAGSALWLSPFLQDKVPFDPVRDFAPITYAARAINILVVHPSVPVKSVKELIALAKARPGELNYGSGGNGSSAHLGGELFKHMAGVNIARVTYKGNGPAVIALLAGEVQLLFPSATAVTPYVKAGKLRALAVGSTERSALLPALPTVAATLPGFESLSIHGIFAPAKTPEAIISRLNQEIVRFLNTPEAKERLLGAGSEAVGSSPEQLTVTIKSEMARLGKVIKDAGITAD